MCGGPGRATIAARPADRARPCRPRTWNVLVLVNPDAAGGRAQALVAPMTQWSARARRPAALRGCRGRSLPRPPPLWRCRAARESPSSAATHAAGDAAGAFEHRRRVSGLVPLGSGNDTARGLGLAGSTGPTVGARARRRQRRSTLAECAFDGRRVPFASSLTAEPLTRRSGLRALAAPREAAGCRFTCGRRSASSPRCAPGRCASRPTARSCTTARRFRLGAEHAELRRRYAGAPGADRRRRLDLSSPDASGATGRSRCCPGCSAGRHLSHPRVRLHPLYPSSPRRVRRRSRWRPTARRWARRRLAHPVAAALRRGPRPGAGQDFRLSAARLPRVGCGRARPRPVRGSTAPELLVDGPRACPRRRSRAFQARRIERFVLARKLERNVHATIHQAMRVVRRRCRARVAERALELRQAPRDRVEFQQRESGVVAQRGFPLRPPAGSSVGDERERLQGPTATARPAPSTNHHITCVDRQGVELRRAR